ncbi:MULTISPECIES: calmodulin [Pseudoalteromonas]|uniref:Calmodulin n=1 Tax=Pseudoalteromonas ruthenica TaxID=151081 RepID=A0A0F4PHJ2_9GAMM|nr:MULTISPECIES: calmodulin [Pseudoalteromonas]KJY94366.1 calmodulin [Pseudoalteromonas ruthenica]KJY94877.1 calmodulin [Pseudoalteromonas ruthenica]MCF2863804.1 calmodulin [Pseudoalteromonas sp. CNAT2-18]MCG7546233.1 calmodulin [Pseudoalteromonas sp. MM17-2]MCG7559446.1 calmodulin [Pseudoalteromonas sp. CNAT2-18.1]|tara:strand:- start:3235 stop:3447 length:213 start_codon:yes stop_codon:yes gene_type:complete
MKGMTSTIAFVTLAASSAVFAADFNALDADGNGAISVQEASVDAALMEQFDQLDTDGNGELSKAEFEKAE